MTALASAAVTADDSSSPPFQVLDENGALVDEKPGAAIDLDLTKSLYRDMALARALDQQALMLQRQGELGLWLMSRGQEAAQVGSIRAVRPTDHVFPSYREHAAALCRGITPGELLAQWRGVAHSGWAPDDRHFHITTLVLGTQTLHAVGYAMAVAHEGADEVVLVYLGDGSTSQGDVNEALNWASTVAAPVVFFCQNNQWAISTPTSKQFSRPLHERAAGFGLRSFRVDGNDVLAVHGAAAAAAAWARSGRGPAFVEAETFRIAGHSTSDDPTRYRSAEELEHWEGRDPLKRVEAYLRRHEVGEAFFAELDGECAALAAEVRESCRALEAPDLLDQFDQVYAEPHPRLTAQRAAASDFADLLDQAERHG